jgi:hypothetical protein
MSNPNINMSTPVSVLPNGGAPSEDPVSGFAPEVYDVLGRLQAPHPPSQMAPPMMTSTSGPQVSYNPSVAYAPLYAPLTQQGSTGAASQWVLLRSIAVITLIAVLALHAPLQSLVYSPDSFLRNVPMAETLVRASLVALGCYLARGSIFSC